MCADSSEGAAEKYARALQSEPEEKEKTYLGLVSRPDLEAALKLLEEF